MQEYLINRETGGEEVIETGCFSLKELSQIYSDNCAYWLKLKPKDRTEKKLKRQKSAYFFKKIFETNREIQIQKYIERKWK